MDSKTILLIISLACVATALPTFEEWAAACGKTYSDDAERDYRQGVYNENVAEMAAKNAQYQAEGVDTFLKPNCVFGDRTIQEANAFLKVSVSDFVATAPGLRAVDETIDPPETVDWRDQGKVSAVTNQYTCGCCWSFATVAMYESFVMIAGMGEHDLSEEYLLQCTTPYATASGRESSCAGGYVVDSVPLALENGLPLELDFPYVSANYGSVAGSESTPGICDTSDTSAWVKQNINGAHYSLRDVDDATLKIHVAYAPVLALIYADSGIMSLGSGRYGGCPDYATSKAAINHAVIIVGYDDYGWIIKNSWGTGWADNGYASISYSNDCALKAYIEEINGDNEVLESEHFTKFVLLASILIIGLLF